MYKKDIISKIVKIFNKKLLFILMISIFTLVIVATGFVSYLTVKQQLLANQIVLQTERDEERRLKNEVLAQLENVIKIRDSYRFNLKEIIELLYNKDTYLGVGGPTIPVKTSDEAILLQMKTVISEMNDDLQLMTGVKNYLEVRSEFINAFPFIWPVKGGIPDISSTYGFRWNPFDANDLHYHSGIDIPGDRGQEIVATADGKVVNIWTNDYRQGMNPVYGNFIIIQHNYDFQTYYGHMDRVNVNWGQEVKKGDVIGYMGNTGKSTGTHLHYEVRHNFVVMNPMDYLSIMY